MPVGFGAALQASLAPGNAIRPTSMDSGSADADLPALDTSDPVQQLELPNVKSKTYKKRRSRLLREMAAIDCKFREALLEETQPPQVWCQAIATICIVVEKVDLADAVNAPAWKCMSHMMLQEVRRFSATGSLVALESAHAHLLCLFNEFVKFDLLGAKKNAIFPHRHRVEKIELAVLERQNSNQVDSYEMANVSRLGQKASDSADDVASVDSPRSQHSTSGSDACGLHQ